MDRVSLYKYAKELKGRLMVNLQKLGEQADDPCCSFAIREASKKAFVQCQNAIHELSSAIYNKEDKHVLDLLIRHGVFEPEDE